MVRARLHIICGNCGEIATNTNPDNLSRTLLKLRVDKQDGEIYVFCDNCATLHCLNDVLPSEKPEHKE